jgi:hypothetical protein
VLNSQDSLYKISEGREVTLALSVIGGPDQVTITANSLSFPLQYNQATNLWQGKLRFEEVGSYQVSGTATDGAGNRTERQLFQIDVLPSGKVTDTQGNDISSTVQILYKDKETGRFIPWQGETYQQRTVQTYSRNSPISWILPPGTYALQIHPKEESYLRAQTTSFTIEKTTLITPQLKLQNNINIPLLKQLIYTVQRQLIPWNPYLQHSQTTQTLDHSNIQSLPNKTVLDQYTGQQFSFVYANTWHPDIAAFLASLQQNTVVVFPHETQIVIDLFKARGDYKQPMLADPDGILLNTIPYSSKSILYDVSQDNTVSSLSK